MNFNDLNKHMQALKNEEHYESDCQLYINTFPKSKLNAKLGKANRFNVMDLSGKILYELLKHGVSPDAIIANREGKVITTARGIAASKKAGPTKNIKKEKYPNIDWDNAEDVDVLLCMGLFNDAVTNWNRMQDAQAKLDKNPEKYSPRIVECDERNRQAYAELQAYNDTGKFLYEHPILKLKKQFAELQDLKENDTDAFMKRQKTAQDSINRYKNQLKNKAYKSEEEMNNWKALQAEYEDELDMIKQVIKSGNVNKFLKFIGVK